MNVQAKGEGFKNALILEKIIVRI